MNNPFPFRDSCDLCQKENINHHHKGYWSKTIEHKDGVYCRCLDVQAPPFVLKPGEVMR